MSAPAAQWTPERSAAGDRSIWLIAAIVSLATFMEVLDVSIANVSLDHIGGSLSASYDESTWILTSYLIANAVAVPISGWLSNVIGRKRFYMIAVAVFTLSSLLCGLAPNLTFLIVARVLQGIGGGGLAPSEQSILAETFPPDKRAGAFALYGLTVIAAPILGPTLGGIITDQLGWHWIFLINVPVGLISLFLVHRFVVDPPKLEEERRARLEGGLTVDYAGIALLILWMGGLEIVLDRGQREDWFASGFILSAAIVSVASGIALWLWERQHKEPVFNVRLGGRSYAISILAMFMTGAVVFGTTQLVPAYLQQVMGYTATEAGRAMTFGGCATVAVLPFAGILTGKVQPKYLMIFGLLSEALALWHFVGLSAEADWWWLAIARTWLAIGIPFLFIPINTAAYADIPADKIADASAQLNWARNLGGSVAISVASAHIEQRSQYHQSRLVEGLSPLDSRYDDWTKVLRSQIDPANADAPVGQIYAVVVREAHVLGYIDAFVALAIIVALVAPLLFFMKTVDLSAPPA